VDLSHRPACRLLGNYIYVWLVGAYRSAMRQLRHSVSALESFVSNHLQYHRADDVRMVNSVSIHFESLVTRLVHKSAELMERYQVTRRGGVVTDGLCRCGVNDSGDVEVSLATDLSRLVSDIRTASRLISLAS